MQYYAVLYEGFFVVLGLVLGSFGNMLIDRVPSGLSLGGRSRCLSCDRTLRAWELIPVFSYLLLGGKCKQCEQSIGIRSQITELLSAAVFLVAALVHTDIVAAAFLALALWLLLIISIIDIRTRTISDGLNLPFVATGIGYSLAVGQFSWTGMALTGGFFGALWLAGKGRWIGSGDVILGTGIGALVGTWDMAFLALMLTYSIGALVIVFLLTTRIITRQHYVAFAPFLAVGAFIVTVFQGRMELVLRLYFGL